MYETDFFAYRAAAAVQNWCPLSGEQSVLDTTILHVVEEETKQVITHSLKDPSIMGIEIFPSSSKKTVQGLGAKRGSAQKTTSAMQ